MLKILKMKLWFNLWLTIKLLVSILIFNFNFFFYSLTMFCSFKVQLYVCCKHVITCVLVCLFIVRVKTVTRYCQQQGWIFFILDYCVNDTSYPCALVLFCNTFFCIPLLKKSYKVYSIFFFSSLFNGNLRHWDCVSDSIHVLVYILKQMKTRISCTMWHY